MTRHLIAACLVRFVGLGVAFFLTLALSACAEEGPETIEQGGQTPAELMAEEEYPETTAAGELGEAMPPDPAAELETTTEPPAETGMALDAPPPAMPRAETQTGAPDGAGEAWGASQVTVTDPASADDANVVQVGLREMAIAMPQTVTGPTVVFAVTNEGQYTHNFEIEGHGIEEYFNENLQPGESGRLVVRNLEPGEYQVYCPVADHAELGMRTTLTVVAPDQPGAEAPSAAEGADASNYEEGAGGALAPDGGATDAESVDGGS